MYLTSSGCGGLETSPSSSGDSEMYLASSGGGGPEALPSSNAESKVHPASSVGGVPETSPNAESGLSLLLSAGAGMPSSSSVTHGATSLLSGSFGASSLSLAVAPLKVKQRWLDGLPMEVLRMVLNLLPDDKLSSLVDANR